MEIQLNRLLVGSWIVPQFSRFRTTAPPNFREHANRIRCNRIHDYSIWPLEVTLEPFILRYPY